MLGPDAVFRAAEDTAEENVGRDVRGWPPPLVLPPMLLWLLLLLPPRACVASLITESGRFGRTGVSALAALPFLDMSYFLLAMSSLWEGPRGGGGGGGAGGV